jgi:hypothetical protein
MDTPACWLEIASALELSAQIQHRADRSNPIVRIDPRDGERGVIAI